MVRYDELFFDITANTYWATVFIYVAVSLSWEIQLWNIFGPEDSNKNVFYYFKALFEMFNLTHFIIYLLQSY